MRKKSIVIALLLATCLFFNISSSTSPIITDSADSFKPLSNQDPIDGNH
ncbi:MAG: hypothetical protein ABS939_00550 [Psychrobacillus sp.]